MLLIAAPLVALVFIFYYLPLFGWIFSFVDYKPGVPIFKLDFVGFKYFAMMFTGGGNVFPTVMRNTLVLSALNLICSPIPVILAIMLSRLRSRKYSRIVQTVTSLPNFISWVLVYSFFFSLFSSDGLFNRILMSIGITDQSMNVLSNPNVAWYFQLFISVWKNAGWSAIIYIAAMAVIDQELYDAADVDGAGGFSKIFSAV